MAMGEGLTLDKSPNGNASRRQHSLSIWERARVRALQGEGTKMETSTASRAYTPVQAASGSAMALAGGG
jgi:hypothetical protein